MENMMIVGIVIVLALAGLIALFHFLFTIEVEEHHSTVVTSFGQWKQQFDQAGDYFLPSKVLPWVKTIQVSRQVRDLKLQSICIHDRNGTSLMIEAFMEYRIIDPKKTIFSVEDWKNAMKSVCLHATTSVLSGLQFEEILKNRSILEKKIHEYVVHDLARWGIELKHFLIQNLSLLPEVNRQVLQGVAAHLEKKKALIEEFARMEALKIEAQTSQEIAVLKGEAGSQMAVAIGKAMEKMKKNSDVFDAYQKLYELSLSKPEQTVVFEGFEGGMSTADASMMLAGKLSQ